MLAALRHWQDTLAEQGADGIRPPILEIANEHGEALTLNEIDRLCRRLNCGAATIQPSDLL